MEFGRLITAMVTPFNHQLQVDWNQTEALIDYLIEKQKSDSLVICGTTGESPTLTEEEKLKLFEVAVKKAAGRCKIIAGTGDNNTMHSISLTQKAESLGVDGILLVSPYYNKPSQEGIYEHYKAISEATKLPIMLYNVPKRTSTNVEADTTIRLSQLDNIVATKEATSDLDHITTIITNTPADFKVYSGDDHLTLPMLSIGGYGVVSVASHVIGKEMKQMMQAFFAGDVQQACDLHGQLHPIFKGLFVAPNPVLVKYALSIYGVEAGPVRPPLTRANRKDEQMIYNLLSY